ncbi:MAG: hypothetical protein M1594_00225 [Candidatus Marsarchaeota archaeon]|nr:hypothetical protein [Candidatus Marsarchaeota archaeon]
MKLNTRPALVGSALFVVFSLTLLFSSYIVQAPPEFFRALGYSLLSVLIVIALTSAFKIRKKSKIFEMLFYSFIFLLVQSVSRIFYALNFYPDFFNLFNFLYVIGYLFFVAALYYLFRNVFIQRTKTKLIASLLVILTFALAFAVYAQPMIFSTASLTSKVYAMASSMIDVIVTTGLVVLMVYINSRMFVRVYGWALLAIALALGRDFILIPARLFATSYVWNFTELLAFIFAMLAYVSITKFLEMQNNKTFSPAESVVEKSKTSKPTTRKADSKIHKAVQRFSTG